MKIPFLIYFKRLDLFGRGVGFTFNGEESYRSVCGAFLSIVVFTLAMLQLNEKSTILIDKADTSYAERTEFGANKGKDGIGYEQTGFNFAFTILPNHFMPGQDSVATINDYSDFV